MSFPILSYHPQDQDPRFMWDCDLANNTYKTPKSEGKKYLNGKEDANGRGDSYLESALSYDKSGFSMNMSYSFVRDSSYGHLKPETVNVDKLSFVTNGGIKLGSTAGFGDGVFEVALLDVRSMVHMVFDKSFDAVIRDQEFELLATAIANPVNGRIRVMVNGIEKVYQIEDLSTLLNAVGYGQYYTGMSAYYHENADKTFDFVRCLKKAYELSSPTTSIEINAYPNNENTAYSKVTIALDGTETYNDTKFHKKGETYTPEDEPKNKISTGNGKIYLQAHWGTSVIYTITSLKSDLEENS